MANSLNRRFVTNFCNLQQFFYLQHDEAGFPTCLKLDTLPSTKSQRQMLKTHTARSVTVSHPAQRTSNIIYYIQNTDIFT